MDMSAGSPKNSKNEIPSLKSLERDFGQKFAYPASTKTYLQGSRADIKAPIRMIEQLPTRVGEELIRLFLFTILQALIATLRL
jgi:phosphomethylpyrimidine synthase